MLNRTVCDAAQGVPMSGGTAPSTEHDMSEAQWRRLGELALRDLPYLGFHPATEEKVRRQLEKALAQTAKRSTTAVGRVLTSRPELREWLLYRIIDDPHSYVSGLHDDSREASVGISVGISVADSIDPASTDGAEGDGPPMGYADAEEFVLGVRSPVADTDDDGISNGFEQLLGTDPTSADTDIDAVPDVLELDADFDLHLAAADDVMDGDADEAGSSTDMDDELRSHPRSVRGPVRNSGLSKRSRDDDADVESSSKESAAALESYVEHRNAAAPRPAVPTSAPGASPTRTAHARLEAPAAVQVEVPFPVLVGLAAVPSAGVLAPAPFQVPAGEFALTVSLLLDGFRTADGSRPERTVLSSPDVPYPAVAIDLVAIDDPTYRAARSVLAEFSIEGHPLGTATRSIRVLQEEPGPRPATAQALFAEDRAPRRPTVWAIPTEGAPDLQITVARGNDEAGRRLLWSAHSPHDDVWVPSDPPVRMLDPEAAGDWARRVMRGVEQRKKSADLAHYLRGVQRLVGDQVPKDIWTALESVAEVLRDPDSNSKVHPAVLFATAEPFVPWELARVPRPWDADRPALLGAQVEFGRWLYDDDNELPAPVVQVNVRDVAVVKGEYTGSARLVEAEEEADHLTSEYGATQVPADLAAVLACLEGRPAADLVHFAVHGRLDVTGLQDGIVMNDKSTLGFESILGVETGRSKLTFLNACQVGEAQEVLGDTAGIVPSFIRIGAQGVIAPLWKVDDKAARGFAERFYAELRAGGRVADFLARERAAAVDAVGSPRSTVLAYLFFGHPRLTVTGLEEKTHAAAPA